MALRADTAGAAREAHGKLPVEQEGRPPLDKLQDPGSTQALPQGKPPSHRQTVPFVTTAKPSYLIGLP